MRGRYGRLNIQFGDILSLHDIRANGDATQLTPEALQKAVTPAKRRSIVTRLAHRVMAEINRATAVTPGSVVAMALLNHHRRGMSDGELLAASERLTKVLKGFGARISKSLVDKDGVLREEAIHDAAKLYMEADMIVANVPGEESAGATQARQDLHGPRCRVPRPRRQAPFARSVQEHHRSLLRTCAPRRDGALSASSKEPTGPEIERALPGTSI